ncbi:hypothetical protein [uncultured Aliivibrio sp.]|uniref:hypothetical protein n=1 Tax=uncultured Aliivibrio sp. TaxID=873085 RepID=UPI00262BEE64|nr:hypothetical protein [uncultured Aliivibrio sp.]
MKYKMTALLFILNLSPMAFANQGANGANGSGGALGPAIDCKLANGDTIHVPELYCKIEQQKASTKHKDKLIKEK